MANHENRPNSNEQYELDLFGAANQTEIVDQTPETTGQVIAIDEIVNRSPAAEDLQAAVDARDAEYAEEQIQKRMDKTGCSRSDAEEWFGVKTRQEIERTAKVLKHAQRQQPINHLSPEQIARNQEGAATVRDIARAHKMGRLAAAGAPLKEINRQELIFKAQDDKREQERGKGV